MMEVTIICMHSGTVENHIVMPSLQLDAMAILSLILLPSELPNFEEMIVQDEQKERREFREMTVLGAAFAAGIPVGMWKDTTPILTPYKAPFIPTSSRSDGGSLIKVDQKIDVHIFTLLFFLQCGGRGITGGKKL